MIRYNIRVNYGDNNRTNKFYFAHKDWRNVTQEESDKAFDSAVKELNRIYKTYGRFATEVGIIRLFESYGFERSFL